MSILKESVKNYLTLTPVKFLIRDEDTKLKFDGVTRYCIVFTIA
jgi:hypothetical protein